tara:strand:- start:2656 stop:3288 length:633 start_codon:yes stop_codon:yes gene_type:complete
MINIEDEWLAALNVRRVLPLLIFLALLGHSQALPTGVNDKGNDGCLCHGGSDESTIVTLSGLPEVYNSSQGYNVTLTIESPVEKNEVQGGFRILISQGELVGEGWQIIDNGYTHTSEINDRRVWDAVWIAPEETDKLATFVIHGNAVNGDNSALGNGDEWNSQSIAIPGPDYTGEVIEPEISNSVSNAQLGVGILAITAVIGLTIFAIKD